MSDAEYDQWEYRTVLCRPQRSIVGIGGYQAWYVDLVDDEPVKGHEQLTSYTNRLGADGWEMFSTAMTPRNSLLLFFRRLLN